MKLGWKTLTGAALAIFGYVSQPQILALLPVKPAGIIAAVGGLLAALGLRHAIAKSGPR